MGCRATFLHALEPCLLPLRLILVKRLITSRKCLFFDRPVQLWQGHGSIRHRPRRFLHLPETGLGGQAICAIGSIGKEEQEVYTVGKTTGKRSKIKICTAGKRGKTNKKCRLDLRASLRPRTSLLT